ncbi:MAG: ATP-grasp domain-containing protein [Gammaproteobacteria bacterium]|nr:ATP-grasp domain-containing protein [Gammaproteobacteria bacterium]
MSRERRLRKKNIFVLGLEEYNLQKLKGIRHARHYRFHGLLEYGEVVKPLDYPYLELLAKAQRQLQRFSGPIDAIITHWDFPADTLAPLLCRKFGLPSPSLEDVLKCGHKYWARLEQQKVIPDAIPRFCAFDPFDKDPLSQIDLPYPFWIKPVKAFGSFLGFYIDSAETFQSHLPTIRNNISRIGDAFNVALDFADLPPEVAAIDGNHCIAEELIRGDRQNGPEGYIYQGKVHVNGITDSFKDEEGKSFTRYEYPSRWPQAMQQKSLEVTERLMSRIGLDNSAFNLEFIWDEQSGALKLLEVNPRISQSLSDMFEKVHGSSNHEVAVELALGLEPDYPRDEGHFNCAAKFMWRHYGDALVVRTPSEEEIRQVKERFPETGVYIEAVEGEQLSTLRDQDSYSYEIAILHIGADDHEQLLQRYAQCREMLTFEFAPAGEE